MTYIVSKKQFNQLNNGQWKLKDIRWHHHYQTQDLIAFTLLFEKPHILKKVCDFYIHKLEMIDNHLREHQINFHSSLSGASSMKSFGIAPDNLLFYPNNMILLNNLYVEDEMLDCYFEYQTSDPQLQRELSKAYEFWRDYCS